MLNERQQREEREAHERQERERRREDPRLRRQCERDTEPRRSCGNRIAIPNCLRIVVRWPC